MFEVGSGGSRTARVLQSRVRSRVPELAVLDPATAEPIGHIPAGGVPEANHAVLCARAAQGAWARLAPEAREALLDLSALAEHLLKSGRWLEDRVDTLIADILACGPSAVPVGVAA